VLFLNRSEKMKVQLIQPPIDREYFGRFVREWLAPPTNLAVIASTIETAEPSCDIEILDGNFLDEQTLDSKVGADFVGITGTYAHSRKMREKARLAKRRGSKVVLGGPDVRPFPERVLINNPFVDYVWQGDGEFFFLLLDEKHLSRIPNLVFRQGSQIKKNKRRDAQLTTSFDLRHLDAQLYSPQRTLLPISLVRGCTKAVEYGRCPHCTIDQSQRTMNPKLAWQHIKELKERYGFLRFYETGDSIIVGDYLERLLRARPKDLGDVEFKFYANPYQITPQTLDTFRKLNTKMLFLGIESYNDSLLKAMNRPDRVESINRALDLLHPAGIELVLAIMLGVPGESSETLENDYEFVKRVNNSFPKTTFLASRQMPLAGSRLFSRFMENVEAVKEYSGDLLREDVFDYPQLARLHTKYFTSTTYEEVGRFLGKIRALMSPERAPGFD